MDLRGKTLSVAAPSKQFSNIYQAYLFERRNKLGKNYDGKKVKAEYAKLDDKEMDRLEELVEDEENRFKEALFHFENTVNRRGR